MVKERGNIIFIKGLTYGIKNEHFEDGLSKIKTIIKNNNITTIIFDGDKCTYSYDDKPRTSSFTIIIEMIYKSFPNIEFIYFKKTGKAESLIFENGINKTKKDDYGNMLGPYIFFKKENTQIIQSIDKSPNYTPGNYYGVEFNNINKWYELGIEGYKWVKNNLKYDNVFVLILGKGNAVIKELDIISKTPIDYPKLSITEIEINRD